MSSLPPVPGPVPGDAVRRAWELTDAYPLGPGWYRRQVGVGLPLLAVLLAGRLHASCWGERDRVRS